MNPVANAQQNERSANALARTMRVGDELSLDNGRIVIRLDRIGERRVSATFLVDPELVVDKPPREPSG